MEKKLQLRVRQVQVNSSLFVLLFAMRWGGCGRRGVEERVVVGGGVGGVWGGGVGGGRSARSIRVSRPFTTRRSTTFPRTAGKFHAGADLTKQSITQSRPAQYCLCNELEGSMIDGLVAVLLEACVRLFFFFLLLLLLTGESVNESEGKGDSVSAEPRECE